MSKELIVSVNGREKKIAIVEDDLVTEFYVERGDENQGIVGNISIPIPPHRTQQIRYNRVRCQKPAI